MVYRKPGYTPEFMEQFNIAKSQIPEDKRDFGTMARLTREIEYEMMLKDPVIQAEMDKYKGMLAVAPLASIEQIPEQRIEQIETESAHHAA